MHKRFIPALGAVGKRHPIARDDREQDTIPQHRAVCPYPKLCFASPVLKVSLVFPYVVPEEQYGSNSRKVSNSCSCDISCHRQPHAHKVIVG